MTHTKHRVLKVSETVDFRFKRTIPQIRLVGQWLENAGIPPNNHTQVENPQPGLLVIRLLENKPE